MTLDEYVLTYVTTPEARLGEPGKAVFRRIGDDDSIVAVKSYASTDFGPTPVSTVRFEFFATGEAADSLAADVGKILGAEVTLDWSPRETFTLSFRSGEPFEDGPTSTAVGKVIVDSVVVDHSAPFYGSGPRDGDGSGWTHYDLSGPKRAVRLLCDEIEQIVGDDVVLLSLPPLNEGTR